MKKLANYLFVLTLVVLFAVCPLNSASAQTGAYFGIWGGYTISPDADYKNKEVSELDGNLDVQETGVFGVKFGFTPPQAKFLAFEFEFSYLNPDIDRSILFKDAVGDYIALDNADAEMANFMFNIIGKYPDGKFHPYLGAGIGFSSVDVSGRFVANIDGVDVLSESDSDSDTSFAWQLLAGLEIDFTNNLSLDVGYRYFVTEPEFETAEIDFSTSMITAGLKFKF